MSLPWFKFDPKAFLDGCVDLPVEERGAYITVLSLIYQRGAPIPDEPRWLAGHCLISVRRWNAIRATLIAKGKLYLTAAGRLMNGRADNELETGAKPQDNSGETSAKVQDKVAENEPAFKENSVLDGTDIDRELEVDKTPSLSAHARQNLDATKAAGDALASLAVCPGIATIAPLRALLTGPTPCDWELDVLPAIASAAAWHRARAGPGSMKSWTTASRIAAENRDRRLAGPPKQNHERPDPHPDSRRSAYTGRLADIDAAMEAAVEPLAVRR